MDYRSDRSARGMHSATYSAHSMTQSEFFTGMVCGAAIGATFALLFTPRPGADVRRQFADGAGRLRERASHQSGDAASKVSTFVSRGRRVIERGRERFGSRGQEGIAEATTSPVAGDRSTDPQPDV